MIKTIVTALLIFACYDTFSQLDLPLFDESINNNKILQNGDPFETVAQINESTIQTLRSQKNNEFLVKIRQHNVILEHYEFRNSQFRIVDGKGNKIKKESSIIIYKVKNEKNGKLIGSALIDRNELMIDMNIDNETILVRPNKNIGSYKIKSTYRKKAKGLKISCGASEHKTITIPNRIREEADQIDVGLRQLGFTEESIKKTNFSNKCLPMAFDIGYELFNALGTVENVERWFYYTFLNVVDLFQRHNINLAITEIKIFTNDSQDPMNEIIDGDKRLGKYYEFYGGELEDNGIDIKISDDAGYDHFLNPGAEFGPTGTSLRHYLDFENILNIDEDRDGTFDGTASGIAGLYQFDTWFGGIAGAVPRVACLYPMVGRRGGLGITNVIGEIGNFFDTNPVENAYPMATAFTIAHEIGHNMGLFHEHEDIPVGCDVCVTGLFANLLSGGAFCNGQRQVNDCSLPGGTDQVGGVMSYCDLVDVNVSFGERAGVLKSSYNSYIEARFGVHNEAWCQVYQIEDLPDPPSYQDFCHDNFNIGPIPFVYYLDNYGHSDSYQPFSTSGSGCSGGFTKPNDIWFTRIPKFDKVKFEFSNLVYSESIRVDVFTGSCNNLDRFACRDITENNNSFTLTNLTPNQQLYFRFYGKANEVIAFAVAMTYPDGVPLATNDICSNATQLEPIADCQYNFFYASTNGLNQTNPLPNQNCVIEDELYATLIKYDQWYKLEVPLSGAFNFQISMHQLDGFTPPYWLEFTNFEALIEIYTGSCNALNYVDCSFYDFDIRSDFNRPDIEVSGLDPGEEVYIKLLLFTSGPTVRRGIMAMCLEEGRYFPENDFIHSAMSMEVQQDECNIPIISSFRRAREEVSFPVPSEDLNLSFDPHQDLWYAFEVPESNQFITRIYREEEGKATQFYKHFELVIYEKDAITDEFSVIDIYSPYNYSNGESSFNGSDESSYNGDFSPGDSIFIQVLLKNYLGFSYDQEVYDFELCIYDTSPCRDSMFLTDNIVRLYGGTDKFYSSKQLKSQSNIISGDVEYYADEEIELISGFTVENGSTFSAMIYNCPHDNEGGTCQDAIDINILNRYFLSGTLDVEVDYFINGFRHYKYKANSDGILEVSSCSQSSDTRLTIWHYSASQNNCEPTIAFFNDDYSGSLSCSTYGSYLSLHLDENEHVIIMWDDTYSSSPFEFELTYTCDNPPDCCYEC